MNRRSFLRSAVAGLLTARVPAGLLGGSAMVVGVDAGGGGWMAHQIWRRTGQVLELIASAVDDQLMRGGGPAYVSATEADLLINFVARARRGDR